MFGFSKIIQAERRKKELVHFLSRGEVYLQAKLKEYKPRGEKRNLFIFYPEAKFIFKRSLKITSREEKKEDSCRDSVRKRKTGAAKMRLRLLK